jgi:hypothetical protein
MCIKGRLRKEGQNSSLPLLLPAREGGRGDEYIKKVELLLFIPDIQLSLYSMKYA